MLALNKQHTHTLRYIQSKEFGALYTWLHWALYVHYNKYNLVCL